MNEQFVVKIGADPELFVKENSKFISAHDMVPGTKYDPYKVPHGAVQVDGMALEFNIDPAERCSDFMCNINRVMKTLRDMVPGNVDMVLNHTADFDPEYLKTLPESATSLGCSPDFNAYTKERNPAPEDTGTMRSASGHVHIGWTSGKLPTDKEHFEQCARLARRLDWFLGVPSIAYENHEGILRRKLYGRAGSFRPKPYGMEYRVLSNYWLKNNSHIEAVYFNALHGYKSLFGNFSVRVNKQIIEIEKSIGISAQDIINDGISKYCGFVQQNLGLSTPY